MISRKFRCSSCVWHGTEDCVITDKRYRFNEGYCSYWKGDSIMNEEREKYLMARIEILEEVVLELHEKLKQRDKQLEEKNAEKNQQTATN